jgi:hypothetical protein
MKGSIRLMLLFSISLFASLATEKLGVCGDEK